MKVLFLVKFFPPYDRGGSEWSTRDLAFLLAKKGHSVLVMTPNFGSKRKETIEGVTVYRIPFPKKLRDPKDKITPFWTNNIIWFIYSTVYTILLAIKYKVQIIHIHSNEFLPAGVVATKLLKKVSVVTLRDYQAICSLGFCLWTSKKRYSFKRYINDEFNFFFDNYIENKSILVYYILKIAAIRSWLMQNILFFFAKEVTGKVGVSNKVKELFSYNGIHGLNTIHNPVLVNQKALSKTGSQIIYVGKLSKGKGIEILIEVIRIVSKKMPNIRFTIIGSGHMLEDVKRLQQEVGQDKIKLTGHISHYQVQKEIQKAALVIVPSIWPEPLPRSAIETILNGVPVVATDVGGINEVVLNNKYGLVVKPNVKAVTKSVMFVYRNRTSFKKNILKNLPRIKFHFEDEVVTKYESLYKKLLS